MEDLLGGVSYTLQGTNISPKNGILKMIFLFPRWDMLIPWRVVHYSPMRPVNYRMNLISRFLSGWIESLINLHIPPYSTNLCGTSDAPKRYAKSRFVFATCCICCSLSWIVFFLLLFWRLSKMHHWTIVS